MKFGNPLHLIVKVGDEPLKFSSDEEAVTWLERQASQWEAHAEDVKGAIVALPSAQGWVTQHTGLWHSYAATAKSQLVQVADADREQAFRSQFDQIGSRMMQGQLLWTGDDLSERALSLAKVDVEASLWTLMIALGNARWFLVDNNNPIFWAQFGRTLVHLSEPKVSAAYHQKQRAAVSNIDSLIGAVTEKINALDQRLESFEASSSQLSENSTNQFSGLLEASEKSASDQRAEFSEEWIKLRATYDRELKLRAPREYWKDKFADHDLAAKSWRKAFFWTAAFSAGVIALAMSSLVREWIQVPVSLKSFGWIVPAGVVGIPAFLALWLLRLCGRQWSDHLLRREDSRERVVMIETFLAISRDSDSPGAVTDTAQLGLVLSSIFRPGPGLANDDSPPAGVIDALLSRMAQR